MDKIKAIKDKMEEIYGKIEAKEALIKAEKRSKTKEERTEIDALMTELEGLEGELAHEQRLFDLQGKVNKAKANIPGNPNAGVDPDPNKDQGWRSRGEFFQAVYRAAVMPHNLDRRLVEIRAISGQSESVPADGGFLVQTDLAAEIFEAAHEEGQIYNRCDRIPISANANGLKLNAVKETSRAYGSQYGGIQTYWLGEGAEITSSKMLFRQAQLNLHKLAALVYCTDELLADAAALENRIRKNVPKAIAFRVDDSIINGDGVAKPIGILNSPALVTVAKTASQTATTITAANIMNMYVRMLASGMKNAAWFINQDTLPQLWQMSVSYATAGGNLVWMPANGISGVPYSTLGGLPVIPIEQCATLGTVGDIILADMSQYLVIEKGGVDVQSSMHVRFIYDEMAYRFIFRIDGQPSLESAITPFKGSSTQSFWIALATRA